MEKTLIYYHIVAFSIGMLLDLIIGDPYWMPHPIKLIGRLISKLDKAFMDKAMNYSEREGVTETDRNTKKERIRGVLCVIIVVVLTLAVTFSVVAGAYYLHHWAGIMVEAVLTAYCLAATSLRKESMKVYKAIQNNDVEGARRAVSMIVGRDTDALDESGIIKAAVETVAENTSDGVIAPMIYLIIGGPILGMTYKAINTMDSMIGYHNDRYENFGRCAAKLDDVVNFIPARVSAWFMILSSFILGVFPFKIGQTEEGKVNEADTHIGYKAYSGKDAIRIYLRDRYNHKSPNSAQTESVCAGALRVQLAGDAVYFGRIVKKPYIGDDIRKIENKDIKRANWLMYTTAVLLTLFFCVLFGTVLLSLGVSCKVITGP